MKSTTDNNVAMLNERYFLKCLDFAQNPIVIWGEKTELLFANTAFCNLFHIPSREKAIGTTLADIMRKGENQGYPGGFETSWAQGTGSAAERHRSSRLERIP